MWMNGCIYRNFRAPRSGLVKVHKEFVNRKPKTTYACTKQGRKEMQKYLSSVEALLQGTTTNQT